MTTRPLVVPTDAEHRVTNLELFFDLVFVFAFTQVTALVAGNPGATGAVRGLLLAALLWWVWCSYSWLGNQARADEGIVRHALFLAMGATMVLALTIPEAWQDAPGGLDAPVVLVTCMAIVQWCHLGVYAIAAGTDRGLLRQIARVAVPVVGGNALLFAGALVDSPSARTAWWTAALAVNYSGIYLAESGGWRLPAPGHFAERYALIVLIALGESVVAIGVGVADLPVSLPVVAATAAAIGLSITLWWLYFDVLAHALEHRLQTAPASRAPQLARDACTYLHFPVVVGVLATAVGVKKVFVSVGDLTHHTLADGVHGLPGLLVAGGPALYLVGLSALRRRAAGTFSRPRLVTAAVLAGLAGANALASLPALAYLALVTVILTALVAAERRGQAAARERYRPSASADGSAEASAAEI